MGRLKSSFGGIMTKVLLSGGAGYIGTHTAVELLNNGYDIVVVDDLSNSSAKSLDRVKQITGWDFPFYEMDVCDKSSMDRIFEENTSDAVIHCAGKKAVGESVARPIEYYRINLNATLSLCASMLEHGVKNIIFSSSATVYSGDNSMPLTESSHLGCSNPYGWTKLMNEQILQDIAKANPGFSVVLLRYFNPVGAHPSGLIGEDPQGIPNNLMPFIAQTAVGKREKISVFGNDYDTPDGTGVRDYLHVVDLAAGHVAALKYILTHEGTDIFNLGTGKGYSVLEMISAFSKACGHDLPYQIVARRPGDLATVYADPKKAQTVLGWKAERTLDDMCADSWNWQSHNPNGYRD